jgi:phytoene dehydrogenase-like protein
MSTNRYDAAVVGAGHNGLVCAALLAKAGLRVIVLERRDRPGGAADTAEIAPGFQAPVAAHTVGRLRRSVIRDLGLERYGLRLLEPAARAYVPGPEGRGLTLWADPARTAAELASWSPADAQAWPRFDRKIRALGSFLATLHAQTPPDLAAPSLRDAVAARGVHLTAMGPWSAGTGLVLLGDAAARGSGAAGQATAAVGGPGTVADALVAAARAAGAEIRLGVEVTSILDRRGTVTGVALAAGEEIEAPTVASGADPKTTLLGLVDPVALGPTLSWEVENLRTPGAVAKVNLALDGLPSFDGVETERLHGRILVAGGIDELERAFDAWKYGELADVPSLEATIPSLLDPSVAPQGGHVMSVTAQWVPYEEDDADRVGDVVLKRLEGVAPGITGLVRERKVLLPRDLEREYGLTGGHPLHVEPGLDSFYAWRPLLGFARYRMPLRGLYLCGAGAHPGGGITGEPGANAAGMILADRRRPPESP